MLGGELPYGLVPGLCKNLGENLGKLGRIEA
jgi:hypothetical protein